MSDEWCGSGGSIFIAATRSLSEIGASIGDSARTDKYPSRPLEEELDSSLARYLDW